MYFFFPQRNYCFILFSPFSVFLVGTGCNLFRQNPVFPLCLASFGFSMSSELLVPVFAHAQEAYYNSCFSLVSAENNNKPKPFPSLIPAPNFNLCLDFCLPLYKRVVCIVKKKYVTFSASFFPKNIEQHNLMVFITICTYISLHWSMEVQ